MPITIKDLIAEGHRRNQRTSELLDLITKNGGVAPKYNNQILDNLSLIGTIEGFNTFGYPKHFNNASLLFDYLESNKGLWKHYPDTLTAKSDIEVGDALRRGEWNPHGDKYYNLFKNTDKTYKTLRGAFRKEITKNPFEELVNLPDATKVATIYKEGGDLSKPMINIKIGNKSYKVAECKTEEEKEKGLLDVQELPEDLGMLFYYNPPQDVDFWMEDTYIPLDIIFINEDLEVISVKQGEPLSLDYISEKDVAFVLEVNKDSGIKEGDVLEFDEDELQGNMKVLAPDGSVQMWLQGGERIVSRRETKILIKKAKKADASKDDKDYKALGRYMFKVLKGQDNRDPEYVEAPEKKDEKQD